MDAGELHRLGRRVTELARAVTAETSDPGLTPGEHAVLQYALRHPGASITEICQSTGFVQSHISTSVARLKDQGLIDTAPDTADGRRSRVTVTDRAVRAIVRRASRPVDEALAANLTDREQAPRVIALLEELAGLLLP